MKNFITDSIEIFKYRNDQSSVEGYFCV